MDEQLMGEKFTFGTFNEAQAVRDKADAAIDKDGYITVGEFLKIIFNGKTGVWVGMDGFLSRWGWQDTLGWKIKQTGYFWVLDTPDPKELQELGEQND